MGGTEQPFSHSAVSAVRTDHHVRVAFEGVGARPTEAHRALGQRPEEQVEQLWPCHDVHRLPGTAPDTFGVDGDEPTPVGPQDRSRLLWRTSSA